MPPHQQGTSEHRAFKSMNEQQILQFIKNTWFSLEGADILLGLVYYTRFAN